jgi:hypothetical protein
MPNQRNVRDILRVFPHHRHAARLCGVSDTSVHRWLRYGIPKRHAVTLSRCEEITAAGIGLVEILLAPPCEDAEQ